MVRKLKLTNDFHNTSITLHVVGLRLSAGQVRRARHALCGMASCDCSGYVGVRGPQYLEGDRVDIQCRPERADGRGPMVADIVPIED